MLTEKQEKFVKGKLDGLTNMDAYRQAYNAENMSYETLQVESSRLASHPIIAPLIEETRAKERGWNLDRIVDEFETVLELGKIPNDKGSYTGLSASNAAITGIGKAIGILSDKIDVNITHTLKPGMSLEELEARVSRLDALEAGVIEGESEVIC